MTFYILTFSPHADFEAFLKSTMLTLIAMVLVDRAVAAAATRVSQIATYRPFEETLTPFARLNAVVFTGAFITTHDTLGVELQSVCAAGGPCNVRLMVAVTRGIGDRGDVRMLLRVRVVVSRV